MGVIRAGEGVHEDPACNGVFAMAVLDQLADFLGDVL